MKLTMIGIALFAGIALATQGLAFDVTSDSTGAFSVDGPAATFTTWATSGGASVTGDFSTQDVGLWISGPTTRNSTGSILIPFSFSGALQAASLHYSAICRTTGGPGGPGNEGYVKLDVIVGTTDTEIFSLDGYGAAYNYTASQTPTSTAVDPWAGYTDISALVAGQSAFNLMITTVTGGDPDVYNGGEFLPSITSYDQWAKILGTNQDFQLTGTVSSVPEPSSMLALFTGLIGTVTCLRRRK